MFVLDLIQLRRGPSKCKVANSDDDWAQRPPCPQSLGTCPQSWNNGFCIFFKCFMQSCGVWEFVCFCRWECLALARSSVLTFNRLSELIVHLVDEQQAREIFSQFGKLFPRRSRISSRVNYIVEALEFESGFNYNMGRLRSWSIVHIDTIQYLTRFNPLLVHL